ncbi:flagellar basal-body MS-ring/collar protein FliF [Paraglaciecola sp. MB-3u-78]|uniref:flagellar basal-body MS-ring/collar protein FliF n=1 Tax=Paraglaciecola sp. MB-3u-78 TaxID=2058332 RepID=UPI000C33BA5D|nr:flagellar basal-body MS-ring/collar protein FliF [Paraglaciecola sp. MB-3u-78]PKH00806.1 flagellar basal body M-ring protein FliF [Paraglaciecola sp. MB-3u-78]
MAEAAGTELAMSDMGTDMYSDDSGAEQKSGFMDTIGSTDMVRQITLIIALVICVAIAVFILIWAQEPDYRPLARMETQELIETLDYLDQAQIDYRLEGNTVYVSSEQYQRIKLGMTRQGITQGDGAGVDIIMQDMGFGVSQRVEKVRLKHAREVQIADTIEEMTAVARAKVLLALPKANVFARREKKASATVVVTTRRGSMISSGEVNSIVDIVASAVQGLEPDRVTVTNSNGRLLNSGSQGAESARSRKEYELEQKRESSYIEKIDSILIPVLGLGNYTAQADVTMDFTSLEQTQRTYNPDLPAIRSEMTVENSSIGGAIAGIPGALTNQPPLDSNIPENASTSSTQQTPGRNHKEETRNYELDTTVSHTKQQVGMIRRLSVSVALDYVTSTAADGTESIEPRSQAELLDIRRLLQGGIGFDVTRGDSLEVVSIPFNREGEVPLVEIPFWEDPKFLPLLKLGGGIFIIALLILVVVRPMVRKLINPDDMKADEFDADEGLDLGDESISLLAEEFDESQVGFAADGTFMLPDLHKDEDVLKAVRALVANEPELSSQVVKNWMLQDD